MQMQIRTLREQRRKLESQDYISCLQKQYGQEISIKNWTNPREYSGEVYNPKQGDSKTPPSENEQGYIQGDTQGSSQDVTPTSNPNTKIPLPKGDLVDLELTKLPALSIRSAVSEYFKINVNWDTKTSRQWLEWAHGENITAEQIARAAETWRADKQFNWTHPTLKGIFEKWQMLMDTKASPLETQSTPLEDWRNEIKL